MNELEQINTIMSTSGMENTFGILSIIINIISLLVFLSSAYGLYLINKKLGEKYPWLSFVPLIQIYNYFTASQKSVLYYLVFPILGIILGGILAIFTFGISLILAYIYFIVMYIKLLNAISKRCNRGTWTTIGLIFIPFIMFPIVGIKMNDKSGEKKSIETKTENGTPAEL